MPETDPEWAAKVADDAYDLQQDKLDAGERKGKFP